MCVALTLLVGRQVDSRAAEKEISSPTFLKSSVADLWVVRPHMEWSLEDWFIKQNAEVVLLTVSAPLRLVCLCVCVCVVCF